MTFGANLLFKSLVVLSREETWVVFMCKILTLPPNYSNFAINFCLLALLRALSCLTPSVPSSPTSSASFFLHHLSFIVDVSAVKHIRNSGTPNCSIKVKNASSDPWEKPSKTNLHLLPDDWATLIFSDTAFSTFAIGTSPSNGSSSDPRVDFTFSLIYFMSMTV